MTRIREEEEEEDSPHPYTTRANSRCFNYGAIPQPR